MELPPRARLRRAALLAALASVVSAGCASQQKKAKVVWPPPPEKARIEFVRAIREKSDLGPGFWRRASGAVLPRDTGSQIVSPSGLALSPDERRVYVTLGGRGRVAVIDRDASSISTLPTKTMTHSVGIAVDADENVYVADRLANAVFVYDRKGGFLRQIGTDVLADPTAIAIDRPAQQLYVLSGADSSKNDHRIEVFALSGKHIRTMGNRGHGPGEFNFPSALCVAPDGSLFVSDMLNFRVQQFDRTGQLVGSFGQLGTGMPGSFDKIKGIAFDAFGNIYVVDSMQGVHIFNPAHQPLMFFAGPPAMGTPGPIVIDSKNRIFVADYSMHAVHEFQLVNTTAADSYDGSVPPPAAPSPAPATPSPPQAQPADAGAPLPAQPADTR